MNRGAHGAEFEAAREDEVGGPGAVVAPHVADSAHSGCGCFCHPDVGHGAQIPRCSSCATRIAALWSFDTTPPDPIHIGATPAATSWVLTLDPSIHHMS